MTLHERAYHTIPGLHPMAHRASQRCLKLASSHVRRFYHSSDSPCLTVAKLLNSSPSDRNVTVNGFVRSIRNQKARSFAVIGDGTSLEPLQALLTPVQAQRYVVFSTPELDAQFCSSLSTGCAVSLTGRWAVSPNERIQVHELHVEDLKVLGTVDPAVSSSRNVCGSELQAYVLSRLFRCKRNIKALSIFAQCRICVHEHPLMP
jgi:aspartyl/asparaginyl-tRNA synthetase